MTYLKKYIEHVNNEVLNDPRRTSGEVWGSIGHLQFGFLHAQGLKPEHQFFDFGCGTLRGGSHFIRYLDEENYIGYDISWVTVEKARTIINSRPGLARKKPVVLSGGEELTCLKNLLSYQRFDFILAQSVFTHLPEEEIEKLFKLLVKGLREGAEDSAGGLYFTFNTPDPDIERQWYVFEQPVSFYEGLCEQFNCKFKLFSPEEYPHPHGQRMARVYDG